MTRAGNAGLTSDWPPELLNAVRNLPEHHRVFVALSGGMDSVLLLHLCDHLYGDTGRLSAIHVNHQIQTNAGETEQYCRNLCGELNVPLTVEKVSVFGSNRVDSNGTGGLEDAARQARYGVFESILGPADLLLMAHHGDDQAETILFRVLRGTGVAGLGGMPVYRPLGHGSLYRPLLAFSRGELLHWASRLGLGWVDDPSNSDERFDRNFLRHSIMPLLRSRWPTLNRRLHATAEAATESQQLNARLASIQFDQCAQSDDRLALAEFSRLSLIEQKNLIRWWVSRSGFPPPSPANWAQLMSEFTETDADREPEFIGQGYALRRFRNQLYLVPDSAADDARASWPPVALKPGEKVRWGRWCLQLVQAQENSPVPQLDVRARQGGERIRVSANGPSKSLKNWLQEQSVPPWERHQLPLVFESEGESPELVGVGNLWVSDRFSEQNGAGPTSGWRLILERDSN